MIRVFSPTDKDFTSNGEAVIRPASAIVHKVDNGDYYLELVCGLEYADYLQANNIIVCDTPQGAQAFRIEANIVKTRTKISVKAWHVFYDTENYVIEDNYVVEKTCAEALAYLNSNTDNESPFTTGSNMPTIASYRCVRSSLQEAVNVILERWGGHLVRDNFYIGIDASTGRDNGVVIQYRKNLKDITVTEEWGAVCTKCLPVGKDGQLLPEVFVYSSVQYDIPYTKVVSFDQGEIERENYDSDAAYIAALVEDLRSKAESYLEAAQYPSINYTIEANVERITDTGDVVQVFDERLGVSLDASVISFDYNVLTGKYDKVEFGTLGASLSGLIGSVSAQVNTAISEATQNWSAFLQAAVEVATMEIWQELGGGHVIISGEQIMVVDSLPASSATYCMLINDDGVSFSSDGITGTFRNALSLSGTLNAQNVNIINATLESFTRGALVLGDGNNTSISLQNASAVVQGTINGSGIVLKGENVYNSLFYSSGNTETIEKVTCSGYLDTSAEKLVFTLPLPRSIKNVTPSLTALKINARGINGAIFTISSSGYDVLSDPDLTTSTEKGINTITITIEASSSLASLGDTPVNVEVVTSSLAFS